MDLRDAHARRDLRLAEPFEVGEAQQEPLPSVEHMEAACESDAVLTQLVAPLDRPVAVELAVLPVDQLGDTGPQGRVELVEPPRDPDRPGSIAQVALDLPVDRGDRVGREVDVRARAETGRLP